MAVSNYPARMYQQHHVDKQDERLGLFQLLAESYVIESALYPGCFVHVTPSFIFPVTTYVDMDQRAKKFFGDPALSEFVARRKNYPQEATITFHAADYRAGFPAPETHFDLLISQYAGFVSQPCKKYLKIGGWLLANNSHGDAGLAQLDPDYELVAVVSHHQNRYRLTTENLGDYFVPKSTKVAITKEYLTHLGRGLGYKKSGSAYVFRRVG